MKGFGFTDENNTQYTNKLTYLEIPILVKGQYPIEKFTPYIKFGALLGLQLSASQDQTPQGGQTQNVDASSAFGGLDFGLLVAGGGEFKVIPALSIFAQFGYSFGLSNINKTANSTITVKNNGFRITTGAIFHF